MDTVLPDLNRPTKGQLEKAMEGHVFSRAVLIGSYQHYRLRAFNPTHPILLLWSVFVCPYAVALVF